jgi:undecaprenyl-diphosphatase
MTQNNASLPTVRKPLRTAQFQLILAVVFLLGFVFMFLGAFGSAFLSTWDRNLLLWIADQLRGRGLTGSILAISALGSSVACLVYALAAALYFYLRKQDRATALHVLVAWFGGAVITKTLKELLQRDRPTLLEHLGHANGFSFPSGHSVSAAVIATTFLLLFLYQKQKNLAQIAACIIALLFVCMIAFSRLYLGVHYPSDVLAGAFLGMAWAFALGAFLSKKGFSRYG